MININIDSIISQSYIKLGELALEVSQASTLGRGGETKTVKAWNTAANIRYILIVLQYRIRFTDDEVNILLGALQDLANINDFPAAPVIFQVPKPNIIVKGDKGDTGDAGTNGTDADIDVVDGTDIDVVETLVGGVKTFTPNFNPYVAPSLNNAINVGSLTGSQPDKRVREQGESVDTPITLTLTKGSGLVTSATYLSDAALDVDLQTALDLPLINSVGSQVIPLVDSAIVADETYSCNISDGVETPIDNDTLSFVFPMFQGDSTSILIQTTLYSQLTKIIVAKSSQSFTYNAVDSYFYFAAPSSYGDIIIRDSSGFNVTSLFIKDTYDVDSSGLAFDWTHEYNVWRHTNLTDISSLIYSIEFTS